MSLRGVLTRVSTTSPVAPASSAPVVAKGLSALVSRWPARAANRARALGAVDYTIPGTFGPLAQPSGNSCWATVFTMLMSWRRQQSLSIEDALASVGQHDARRARQISEGRGREVVAGDQGAGHQGALAFPHSFSLARCLAREELAWGTFAAAVALGAHHKAETEECWPMIKAAGIKLQ